MEKYARNATEFLISVDLGKVWPPLHHSPLEHRRSTGYSMGSPTIVRGKRGGLLPRKWENRSRKGNLGSPTTVPTEYHTLTTKHPTSRKSAKRMESATDADTTRGKIVVDLP